MKITPVERLVEIDEQMEILRGIYKGFSVKVDEHPSAVIKAIALMNELYKERAKVEEEAEELKKLMYQ